MPIVPIHMNPSEGNLKKMSGYIPGHGFTSDVSSL